MQITYCHRVKRSYLLSKLLDPSFPRHRFKCHCQRHPYRIICPSCISLVLGLNPRCKVPISWLRINKRTDGKCLVDIIGGVDRQQDLDLFSALGVAKADIEEIRGIKSPEEYAVISRADTDQLIKTARAYFVAPCPNQIREGSWLSKRDRDPDEDADWSDGTKNILYQGELVETNLPLPITGVRYFVSIYKIERTPEYPAKFEIIALAPDGKWMDEESLKPLRKAMWQFLLGVCQAAGIEPQPIPGGTRMQGEAFKEQMRGRKVNAGDIRRAAALADTIDMGQADYPVLKRDTIRAALCCSLGRFLDSNAIAVLLNGRLGCRAFQRVYGTYSYRWRRPIAVMNHLCVVVGADEV